MTVPNRRQQAFETRVDAAELARSRSHRSHQANGEEHRYRHDTTSSRQVAEEGAVQAGQPSYLASFTKGLAHDPRTGLIQEPADYQAFVRGIDSGDPGDFERTPLGPQRQLGGQPSPVDPLWAAPEHEGRPVRAWESAGAGLTFDLQGPDAQADTMPPAPVLGSAELSGEMGEVYAQALLRDVPFAVFGPAADAAAAGASAAEIDAGNHIVGMLQQLAWFDGSTPPGLLPEAARRRRTLSGTEDAFRGNAPGDLVGPYISQFLLAGNRGINGQDPERERSDGRITYGAVDVDQRVRTAQPGVDYMTTWDTWLDVQDGVDVRGSEAYVEDAVRGRRFITTPRDLATYVHYDALFEAYLNACLWLLGEGMPLDPGMPFTAADIRDHQQGFAQFGGPHILSLVTEVATRALKAVRFQKFNVHRRLRPEALGGRLEKLDELRSSAPELGVLADDLEAAGLMNELRGRNSNVLLPMAFPEGSPMHPSYGAGHATVAGACVTILKAFFDTGAPLNATGEGSQRAFVAHSDGQRLVVVDVLDEQGQPGRLTVEGELNKLAANISIGRDWAGVHYYTDYDESLRLGERIAIGLLEEQKLTYGENFSWTVPTFDGPAVRI